MAGDGGEKTVDPQHKDYVPVSTERLFASLCDVRDILTAIKVPYVLSGGTLLGAVREGDLIDGDTDWDLEILDSGVEVILRNRKRFAEMGMTVVFPTAQALVSLAGAKRDAANPDCRIMKVFDTGGGFLGDFFVQTLFSDGNLRRVNFETKAYVNSKMAFPYWFFENRGTVSIRGEKFSCPAEPELMVRRIYGNNWRTPLKRHTQVKGLNLAGADKNANIEMAIHHALSRGWIPHYPKAPKWPMEIVATSAGASAGWIRRHEHLEITARLVGDLDKLSIEECNAVLVLLYRAKISRLKVRLRRAKLSRDDSRLKLAEARKRMAALRQRLVAERDALKPRGFLAKFLRKIERLLSPRRKP